MGTQTTKKYFYKPAYGASGETEMGYFHAALDVVDSQMPVFPQAYATGTGTSGDPWANNCLNSAYTACPAGGTIYLRAGYYTLASTLTIRYKTVNIIGEGIGKTFIVTSMDHSAAMIVYDDYATLKGFTLDADSQAIEADRYAIKIINGSYITIEDIEVKNAGYAGIEFADCDYTTFRNLYLHDNSWLGLHAAHQVEEGGKHNIFQYIYIWGHTHQGFDDGNDEGPWLTDCDNVYDNIHSWDNGEEGIIFYAMVGGIVSNCHAWDNFLAGLSIQYSTNLSVSNSEFSFNENADAHGIAISYSDNITLSNVSANNNYEYGIRIGHSSNITLNNVRAKNNGYSGITLTDASDGIRLINCQFFDEESKQDYGIYNDELTAWVEVTNCQLLPNVSGATVGSPKMFTREGNNNTTFGTAAPTDGTWRVGDICRKTNTTSTTSPGWVCTTAGTPGTWTAMPNLTVLNQAAGDIQYFDGTNWVRLAKGTANQYLKMNAGATAPIWVT